MDALRPIVALGLAPRCSSLLPSIGACGTSCRRWARRPLLPSLEAAYPWLLALIGTSLYTGFGQARRMIDGTTGRRRRIRVGMAIAAALTLLAGTAFGGAAIANEFALRDLEGPQVASRFGPTQLGAGVEPPPCDGRLVAGLTSHLTAHFSGSIDGRPIGTVDLTGQRAGSEFRWLAYVATNRELGQHGLARRGNDAWIRTPTSGWVRTKLDDVIDSTLDLQVVRQALTPGVRAAAEDYGIEVIERAPARRCPRVGRRACVPGKLPAGRVARRRRRSRALARPARLLGLPRWIARPARGIGERRGRWARGRSDPGSARCLPDGDGPRPRPRHPGTGVMSADDGLDQELGVEREERFGKRDRLARMLRVVAVLRGHPEGIRPIRDRATDRRGDEDRLSRSARARGRRSVSRSGRRTGRWGVVGEEFLPPLKLTLDEAMAVVLSARLMVRYADKYDPDLAAAFEKLEEVLPRPLAEHVERTLDVLAQHPRDAAFSERVHRLTRAGPNGGSSRSNTNRRPTRRVRPPGERSSGPT
jgi:hypothetical protein